MFPLALAFAGLFGMDAIVPAGYINAAAFGLTAFAKTIYVVVKPHRISIYRGMGDWCLRSINCLGAHCNSSSNRCILGLIELRVESPLPPYKTGTDAWQRTSPERLEMVSA